MSSEKRFRKKEVNGFLRQSGIYESVYNDILREKWYEAQKQKANPIITPKRSEKINPKQELTKQLEIPQNFKIRDNIGNVYIEEPSNPNKYSTTKILENEQNNKSEKSKIEFKGKNVVLKGMDIETKPEIEDNFQIKPFYLGLGIMSINLDAEGRDQIIPAGLPTQLQEISYNPFIRVKPSLPRLNLKYNIIDEQLNINIEKLGNARYGFKVAPKTNDKVLNKPLDIETGIMPKGRKLVITPKRRTVVDVKKVQANNKLRKVVTPKRNNFIIPEANMKKNLYEVKEIKEKPKDILNYKISGIHRIKK
jgi:hypothetical protein